MKITLPKSVWRRKNKPRMLLQLSWVVVQRHHPLAASGYQLLAHSVNPQQHHPLLASGYQ